MTSEEMLKPLSREERVELEQLRIRFNESVGLAQAEIEKITRYNQAVIVYNALRRMGIR